MSEIRASLILRYTCVILWDKVTYSIFRAFNVIIRGNNKLNCKKLEKKFLTFEIHCDKIGLNSK